MTVQSTTSKMAAQAMNGVATVFSFTFRALVEFPEGIKATILDTTTDTETDLIKDDPGVDGYTVSVDADGVGGSITVIDARSADYTITIYREYTIEQLANYADYNAFPAETVENSYDLRCMIEQQLDETLGRALVLPITVTGVDTTLPVPEAGAPIGWNDTATGLTNNPDLTNLSQIDSGATPDFIGATGADGVLRAGTGISYTDGGDFVTLGVSADYSVISGNDAATDVTGAELETLTDGSNADALHVHASITDDRVKVDAGATADYIGDTSANGVLRVDSTISYTDGGDFVTLGVADNTSTQRVEVVKNSGAVVGTRKQLNFIEGANVTLTIADDAGNDQVDITIAASGGGGGATLTHDVNQATHGFSVNDWIYHNGTQYALADASAAGTAESIGVVSAVAGVDDFTVQFGGRITGLSGLTAGEAHFLSETAGDITATAPTTVGAVIKPVLIADSTTTGFIFNMRGIEVTATQEAGVYRESFVDGDLSSGVLTVNHAIGQKVVQVSIYNNNDDKIMPDDITLTDTDNLDIDLTSFGTLSGTWNLIVIG